MGDECVFYTWRRTGLADEVGSYTIVTGRGEGGHGAARLDRVIYSYNFNPKSLRTRICPRYLEFDPCQVLHPTAI